MVIVANIRTTLSIENLTTANLRETCKANQVGGGRVRVGKTKPTESQRLQTLRGPNNQIVTGLAALLVPISGVCVAPLLFFLRKEIAL